MSKAEQLGAGRFAGGGKGVSARRAAIDAATGAPTAGIAPPTELPPHRISLNPDNPRTVLGDLTDLAGSLKDHGQKTAITVMNRDAYILANPATADSLEADTTHVVVDGSRRLAAAREAGLDTVKVMVDDGQGGDQDALLESALVANVHREDMDPLDEARALQRLLEIHGSQRALARRLHRSQGWVSQRLALLGLVPELAEALERGTESVDLLRAVGNKPKEQQQTVLDDLKAARAAKEESRRSPAPSRAETVPQEDRAPGDYAVITPTAQDTAPGDGVLEVDKGHGEPSGSISEARPVPEPRSDTAPASPPTGQPEAERRVVKMPWHDGLACADIVLEKMAPPELHRMMERLLEHRLAAADARSAERSG